MLHGLINSAFRFSTLTLLVATLACPAPPAPREPGAAPPAVGGVGGGVTVIDPPPPGPVTPEPEPEPEPVRADAGVTPPTPPPPTDPEGPDPTSCPFNGAYVNCVELLSPNNLCASVFPEPEVPGAPVVPNFPLVIACITCDPAYQNLPLDVCEPVLPPVVEPDPPLDAGPQDVVIEDVVIEDVEYEDVVIEDVVIEDVEYEDVVIEDVEYEDVVIEDVEPPPPPPPPPEPLPPSTCKTCHAPNDYNGQYSIEDPHPWVSIDCVGCHGGDGTATNPVFAHVCPPPEIGSRYQQVFDQRAFFLSYTRAGVQLLPNYTCPQ